MRRVSNRRTIRRLSFRTMKEKGWKNLIAVFAIALTSLLFTALFTVGMNLIGSIQEATMRQVGTRAHGGYKCVRREVYEKVKDAPGIREISYNIVAGFAEEPELYGIQTEVRYSEEKSAEWGFCLPEQGRMPKEGNECAASTKVLDALGIPLELGAEVPLHIRIGQNLVEDTFTLTGWWEDTGVSFAEEFWISEDWLLEHVPVPSVSYEENVLAGGGPEGYMDINIMLLSGYNIEGRMNAITEWADLDPDVMEGVNWAYLTSGLDAQSVLLAVVLLAIILLAGYLIIYNIFYINVTSDIRYYGLLKTVGTTGRQLKHMVREQALFLSAAGIPVGLLSGLFAGKALLPVVYRSLSEGYSAGPLFNPWIFVGSTVFSLLVVYISCIRPCRLAARVSPIEAVRYTAQAKLPKKEKRSGRVTMLRLAAANMGRNRKKAVVVILSLSLCLVLFNAAFMLVTGFDFEKYTENYLSGDCQIKPDVYVDFAKGENHMDSITDEIYEKVKTLPGVKEVSRTWLKSTSMYLSDEGKSRLLAFVEEHGDALGNMEFWKDEWEMAKENGSQSAMVYGIPESMLSHLKVREGRIDVEKLKTGRYVLADKRTVIDGVADWWISPGDKIRFSKEGEELEVMAVVDMPSGMGAQHRSGKLGVGLLVDEGAFADILSKSSGYMPKGGLNLSVELEEGKEKEAMAAIGEMLRRDYPNFKAVSRESLREEFSSYTDLFSITGGMLCLILGLIGVLNFINAVITGILARKQEFAMMESVGMTGRQLRHMLICEGLIYALWTAALTTTAGNAAGYLLIRAIAGGMAYFTWHFTMLPMLCGIPFLVLLSVAVPFVSYHFLCKKSIVERLRLAEV